MYTHISVCVCMCDSAAVLKVVQHCSVCLLCYYCCCCCNMQCVYCLQLISQSLFTHLPTILYCRYARTLYKYNSLIIELFEQPREILLLIFNALSAFCNNENNFAA